VKFAWSDAVVDDREARLQAMKPRETAIQRSAARRTLPWAVQA